MILNTLLLVAILVLLAVVLGRLGGLEQRLQQMQTRLRQQQEAGGRSSPLQSPPPAAASVPPPPVPLDPPLAPAPPVAVPAPVEHAPAAGPPPVPSSPAPRSARAGGLRGFERQIGQRLLLLCGLVILVIGIVYFLRYSIERGWIPPAVRIAMVYLGGAGLLAVGDISRRKGLRLFGLSLAGAGCCTFYFASFAGYQLYGLLPQSLAFALAVVTTGLACALALIYDGKWLAVLGLAGGVCSPAAFSGGEASYGFLFTYLALLNAGVLAIAFRKRWALLNHLAMWFTWGNVFLWIFSDYPPETLWGPLLFQGLFFLIYAIAPFAYFLTRAGASQPVKGFLVIIPNALLSLAAAAALLEGRDMRLLAFVCLAYAMVFLALTTWLRRRNPTAQTGAAGLLVQAAFFIALAVPVALDGLWVSFSWALLAAAIFALSRQFMHRLPLMAACLLLAAGWWHLFAIDYPYQFGQSSLLGPFEDGYLARIWQRALSVFALGAATIFGAVRCRSHSSLREAEQRWAQRALGGVALFLGFVIGTREVGGLFQSHLPRATDASLSVYWALFALGLIVAGFARQVPVLRASALALFALTGVKVFLVDMAEASTPFRILSFTGVGLVLILGSFIYHRYREASAPGQVLADESTTKD